MIAPIIIGAVVILIAMYVMSKKPEPQKIMLNTNVVDVESPVDKKQKGSTSASGQEPGTPEPGTRPGTPEPGTRPGTPEPGTRPGTRPGTPDEPPERRRPEQGDDGKNGKGNLSVMQEEGDGKPIQALLNGTGEAAAAVAVAQAEEKNRVPLIENAKEAEKDRDSNGRYLQYLIYIAYLYHIINNKSQFNSVLETAKSIYPSVDQDYIINIIDSKSVNEITWKNIKVEELEQHLNTINKVCVGVDENINPLEITYYEEADYKNLSEEDQNTKNRYLHNKISNIQCKSSNVTIEEQNIEGNQNNPQGATETNTAIVPIEANTEPYDVKSQIKAIKELVEQLQKTDKNSGYQTHFENNTDFDSVLSKLEKIDDDNYQEKIRTVICPSTDYKKTNDGLLLLIKELKKVPLDAEPSYGVLDLKLCWNANELTLKKKVEVQPSTDGPPAAQVSEIVPFKPDENLELKPEQKQEQKPEKKLQQKPETKQRLQDEMKQEAKPEEQT